MGNVIRFFTISSTIFLMAILIACNSGQKTIISDSFEAMDNWVIEQVEGGSVEIVNGKLDIDDYSGCTIWYKYEIESPCTIEYDAIVIDNGGANDRVSDLNCFWMAKDLTSPDDFFKYSEQRGGRFANYHNLRLYYVGLGGHDNTKTRFRRYEGNGNRPVLPENDLSDKKFLISPNVTNQIKIVMEKNKTQYYYNDMLVFDIYDSEPYNKGYFGFRTYKNHMQIDNFKVSKRY